MRIQQLFLWLFLLVAFAACKKTEEVIVSGNVPPEDSTVEAVVYENYINRSYILLLGREPDSLEYATALSDLKAHAFSKAERVTFLNVLCNKPDYYNHTFDNWRIQVLNNVDTTDVENEIQLFTSLLSNTSFQFIWPQIREEINRMKALQDTMRSYLNGQMPLAAVQEAMADNYFYDQINMGAVNFVNAGFQHFIGRSPEVAESDAGVLMVGGQFATLFLKTGGSKKDFLRILFSGDDYRAGMVLHYYTELLRRSPNTAELSAGINLMQNGQDVKSVQIALLSGDEFAGIQK